MVIVYILLSLIYKWVMANAARKKYTGYIVEFCLYDKIIKNIIFRYLFRKTRICVA